MKPPLVRKDGQPDRRRGSKGRTFPPTADRLWSRVVKGEGCWEWTGTRNIGRRCLGYGHIRHQGRSQPTHRVAWELTYGPVPDGLWVLHHCDNPVCVRPDHLYLGTHQDNMNDKTARGRNVGAKGTRNAGARLTEAQVVEIRRRRASGERVKDLAAEFGVSTDAIRLLVTGRTWSHIDEVDVALFFDVAS